MRSSLSFCRMRCAKTRSYCVQSTSVPRTEFLFGLRMRPGAKRSFANSLRVLRHSNAGERSGLSVSRTSWFLRHIRDERNTLSVEQIKTVAVLGAGTMGNGIAHVFA